MKTKIDNELKQAMLSGDSVTKETLRSVKAEISKSEKANGNISADDNQVMKILEKLVKSRKESISIYRANNRVDLAEKEEAELAVLVKYVPEKLDEAETTRIVKEAIMNGSTNIGMLMKHISSIPNIDKKLAQEIYKTLV